MDLEWYEHIGEPNHMIVGLCPGCYHRHSSTGYTGSQRVGAHHFVASHGATDINGEEEAFPCGLNELGSGGWRARGRMEKVGEGEGGKRGKRRRGRQREGAGEGRGGEGRGGRGEGIRRGKGGTGDVYNAIVAIQILQCC